MSVRVLLVNNEQNVQLPSLFDAISIIQTSLQQQRHAKEFDI